MVESEVGMVWSRKGGSAPARVPDRPRPLHHLAGRPGRMTLGEVCEHEKTPAVTGVLKAFGVCWVSRKTERVGFEPTEGCPSNDFESFAFDHSATSPGDLPTLGIGLPGSSQPPSAA